MNFTPKRAEEPTQQATRYELVTRYMTTEVISFTPDTPIEQAMNTLLHHNISGAPVLDEHRMLVGILSEKDCLRVILESAYYNEPPESGKVADYMSHDVTTISADMDVLDVANYFLNSNFRRFPVVDNGRLVGLVSRRDILRAALKIKSTTW